MEKGLLMMLIGSGGDGIPGDNAESNQRDFDESLDLFETNQEWNDEIFVR